eukprot:jgi/Bigna1/146543/aug1.116_g21251
MTGGEKKTTSEAERRAQMQQTAQYKMIRNIMFMSTGSAMVAALAVPMKASQVTKLGACFVATAIGAGAGFFATSAEERRQVIEEHKKGINTKR